MVIIRLRNYYLIKELTQNLRNSQKRCFWLFLFLTNIKNNANKICLNQYTA